MDDKAGSRSRASTVITVMSGKPEQLAHLTSSWATTGIDPAPSTAHEAATPMNHDPRQPGRELNPLPAPSMLAEIIPAHHAPLPALQALSSLPPSGPTPMALLIAFRRRWLLAVGLGMLAATVAGTAAWFLVPPAKFAAEAALQVDSRMPVVVFATAETQNQAQDEYKRYQKSQINLVKSRLVLVSALG